MNTDINSQSVDDNHHTHDSGHNSEQWIDIISAKHNIAQSQRLADLVGGIGVDMSRLALVIGRADATHLPLVQKRIDEVETAQKIAVVVVTLPPKLPFVNDVIARAKKHWQREVLLISQLESDDDFDVAARRIANYINSKGDAFASSTASASFDSDAPKTDDMHANAQSDSAKSIPQQLQTIVAALKNNDLSVARATLTAYLENHAPSALSDSLRWRLALQGDESNTEHAIGNLEKCAMHLTASEDEAAGIRAFLLSYKAKHSMKGIM